MCKQLHDMHLSDNDAAHPNKCLIFPAGAWILTLSEKSSMKSCFLLISFCPLRSRVLISLDYGQISEN